MDDEENSINLKKEIEKVIPKNKLSYTIKKPLTPYFLFCKEKRKEYKDKHPGKKIMAKTLGQMWQALTEEQKKPYIDQYTKEKEEYDILVTKLNQIREKSNRSSLNKEPTSGSNTEDEEEDKRPSRKVKVKTSKEEQDELSKKVCNCGRCDDCIKNKKKKQK